MALKSKVIFVLLATKNFQGEYFVKDLDLEKNNCRNNKFVNHKDRGANNFVRNNTDNQFEPKKTRPRRTFKFKSIESKNAF